MSMRLTSEHVTFSAAHSPCCSTKAVLVTSTFSSHQSNTLVTDYVYPRAPGSFPWHPQPGRQVCAPFPQEGIKILTIVCTASRLQMLFLRSPHNTPKRMKMMMMMMMMRSQTSSRTSRKRCVSQPYFEPAFRDANTYHLRSEVHMMC